MTGARKHCFDGLSAGDRAAATNLDCGYAAGNQINISGAQVLCETSGEKIEGWRVCQELIP